MIVEDGSIVAGADTYVNVTEARAILTPLGKNISLTEATAETQLRNALAFIESYKARYIGNKKTREQALQWPRYNAVIDGFLVPSDSIPTELKKAQAMAAYEIANDEELQANDSGKKVASETLGSMSISYFENGATESTKVFTKVISELSAVLQPSGNIDLVRT